MKQERKRIWISWALWLAVILVLAQFMRREVVLTVTAQEEGLSFLTASGYAAVLEWEEIASVQLKESFPLGTLVEGTDNKKEKSGIWRNEECGEYELIMDAGVESCIVCTKHSGGVIVFNFESAASTQSLYEAIVEKLGGA